MAKIARTEMGTVLTPSMKKDPEFLAKVLALEQEKGRPICGFKKKDGEPCRNPPAYENGRCRTKQHAGKNTGPKTDQGKQSVSKNAEKHGGYSKITYEGLDDDEKDKFFDIPVDISGQIDETIRLLQIRENRWLVYIQQLRNSKDEFMLTKKETEVGIEKDKKTALKKNTSEARYTIIANAENELNKVQKLKIDLLRLKLQIELNKLGEGGEGALDDLARVLAQSRKALGI